MLRIAWRSLMTRPVRAIVLACGFGFGIAVMAMLLGVGHVILEQARAADLYGGGDVVISSAIGAVDSARYVTTSVLGAADLAPRIAAVSPSRTTRVWLMSANGPIAIEARGGVPSLEKAIGDAEVSPVAAWTDAPGDERWSHPDPTDVLRSMDRFHPIPDVPRWSSSWSEWLYFNGRTADGRTRVYVTFSVGPRGTTAGTRQAGVRVQLERDGVSRTVSVGATLDEAAVLSGAPDLDIAGNRVTLDHLAYHLTLAVGDISGDIVLTAAPGRSMPPAAIYGAAGWVSGYTVPVLSGQLSGSLRMGHETISLDGATGYHDHNWGFWEGVRWQWGQVAHDDLSIVYGRVLPPADVADPDRIPGFLAVLGPTGPIAFSTEVGIDESADGHHIEITSHGRAQLAITFDAADTERTALERTRPKDGSGVMNLLQMGGTYQVRGRAAERTFQFSARGSAETFRR